MEQQQQISILTENDRFEGYLMVRSAERRKDSRGNYYLDLNLTDRSGEINCKHWDKNAVPPTPGTAVHVTGQITVFNGRVQMKILSMRNSCPEDNVDFTVLIPCAPEKSEVMMQQIQDTIEAFSSDELRRIVQKMLEMTHEKLAFFPAAMRMHHAEKGGLLHHTTDMLQTAKHILKCYPFLNSDLLLAGVIIHDLAKTVEMESDELGNVSDYTRDGLLVGHLVRGVSMLDEAASAVGVRGEWLELLEHMMISHHGIPDYGSPKYPMFPEAEVLHWIDLLDARMNEMKAIEDRTPPGAFSEKIQSLDGRRMYHPLYNDKAD